jgi:hypothetical protein
VPIALSIIVRNKEVIVNDCERTPCEVWTRVHAMGYFRRYEDYNIGKQSEFRQRKWYKESNTYGHIN